MLKRFLYGIGELLNRLMDVRYAAFPSSGPGEILTPDCLKLLPTATTPPTKHRILEIQSDAWSEAGG